MFKTKLRQHQPQFDGLLNHRVLGPNTKLSDSAGLGYSMRVCILHKFLGDSHADGPRTQGPHYHGEIIQVFCLHFG